MGDEDPLRAYQAGWRLARCPWASVPFLQARLASERKADAGVVAGLIRELDDDSFEARERASARLLALGEAAEAALAGALLRDGTSLEVRQRIKDVLRALERQPQRRRHRAALLALGQAPGRASREALRRFAAGGQGSWFTAEAARTLRRVGASAKE